MVVLRGAFVLRIVESTERRLRGWIEEVDTGKESRFNSAEELLAFLGRCFDEAQQCEHGDNDR